MPSRRQIFPEIIFFVTLDPILCTVLYTLTLHMARSHIDLYHPLFMAEWLIIELYLQGIEQPNEIG